MEPGALLGGGGPHYDGTCTQLSFIHTVHSIAKVKGNDELLKGIKPTAGKIWDSEDEKMSLKVTSEDLDHSES